MRYIAVFTGNKYSFWTLTHTHTMINDIFSKTKLSIYNYVYIYMYDWLYLLSNVIYLVFTSKIKFRSNRFIGMSRATALGKFAVVKVTKSLNKLKPDILVLLGDRRSIINVLLP